MSEANHEKAKLKQDILWMEENFAKTVKLSSCKIKKNHQPAKLNSGKNLKELSIREVKFPQN